MENRIEPMGCQQHFSKLKLLEAKTFRSQKFSEPKPFKTKTFRNQHFSKPKPYENPHPLFDETNTVSVRVHPNMERYSEIRLAQPRVFTSRSATGNDTEKIIAAAGYGPSARMTHAPEIPKSVDGTTDDDF